MKKTFTIYRKNRPPVTLDFVSANLSSKISCVYAYNGKDNSIAEKAIWSNDAPASLEIEVPMADLYNSPLCPNEFCEWEKIIFIDEASNRKIILSSCGAPIQFSVTMGTTALLETEVGVSPQVIDMKKEKEKNAKMIYFVLVRFGKDLHGDEFNLKTKLYTYAVDREFYEELGNSAFQLGSIIYINEIHRPGKDRPEVPYYSNTPVRIEGYFTTDDWYAEQTYQNVSLITKKLFIRNTFSVGFLAQHHFKMKQDGNIVLYKDENGLNHGWEDLICWERQELKNTGLNISASDIASNNLYIKANDNFSNIYTTEPFEYNIKKEDLLNLAQILDEADYNNVVETIESINKENKNGGNTMSEIFNNLFDGVEFGKLNTKAIKYSINGVAFADQSGKYFVYKGGKAIDVTGMTIEAPLFAAPVAVNQVKVDDIIYFKNKYVIIKAVEEDGLKVIDPIQGDIKTIIPQTNIFNFNYYTKVFNPFESISNTANANNPFGNLFPLMMFSDITKGNDGDMIKFMMLSQMNGGAAMDINSMLPYLLMGDKKDGDSFFTIMLLMNFMNQKPQQYTSFGTGWDPLVNNPFTVPTEYKVEIGDNPAAEPKIT